MARAFPFAGQESGESDYYLLHRESGVVEGLNISFSGLTWSLSPGQVFAGGAMIVVDGSAETGASTPTSAASPRRDMLVARRVLVPGGRSYGEIDVIQGGPATSPSDPTLTQDVLGTFEEPLFSWQVPGNGGGTVTGVTDLRRYADVRPLVVGDTDWVNINLISPFQAISTSERPQVRRRDGVLYFQGGVSSSGMSRGGTHTVANLSGLFLPGQNAVVRLGSSNGAADAVGFLSAGGELQVRPSSTSVLGPYYKLDALSGTLHRDT